MKKIHLAVFVTVLMQCLAPVTTYAAEELPCRNIEISAQVDDCVRHQYAAADQQLNGAYRELMKKIDTEYKGDQKLAGDFKSSLKTAQQAWIKYRDANCAVEAFDIEPGTVAHDTATRGCKLRMTEARTQEIKSISW